jgi:hypothetical protein
MRKSTGSLLRRQQHRRYLHRARPEPVHRLAAPISTTQVDVTLDTCLKRDALLRRTLDAMAARSYPYLRVLIADYASTDAAADIE